MGSLRSRVYTAVMTPFVISVCGAAAVLLARTFLRKKLRVVVLFSSEERSYEILGILTRTATFTGDVATDNNNNTTRIDDNDTLMRQGGACVEVILNWNNAKLLRVPALVFDDEKMGIKEIFEVYCGLARNKHPNKLLVCDMWNCLMSLVEHNLRGHLKDHDMPLIDQAQVEELLSLCILLRGKYSIYGLMGIHQCSTLVIQDFPEEPFQSLKGTYYKERSTFLGIISFLKLLCSSYSMRRLLFLASVFLLSPDTILKGVFGLENGVNWTQLYVAEMGNLPNVDVSKTNSFFHFLKEQIRGSTGRLATIAIASVGLDEFLYTVRNFIMNYIMIELVMSFQLSAYLALATVDYDPSDNWPLSFHISNALWHVSSSVMGELQNQVHQLLEIVSSFWVVVRFPIMAVAMWFGTQWSDYVTLISESLYLELQYAKSLFYFGKKSFKKTGNKSDNNKEYLHNDQLVLPSPIRLLMKTDVVKIKKKTVSESISSRSILLPNTFHQNAQAQHGLVLLTLISLESKVVLEQPWILLIQHISWPFSPIVFAEHIMQTLEGLARYHNMTFVGVEKVQWLKTILKNIISMNKVTSHSTFSYHSKREYVKGFTTFRYAGVELAAAMSVVNDDPGSRNDMWENFLRDILSGIFRTANAIPLLLASSSTLYAHQEYLEQSPLEQNNTLSHLEFIQYLFPLFLNPAGFFYEENGLSEGQIDLACTQRKLTMGGGSLGCYQVLEGLQRMQKIDRPITTPVPPIEGPWSIEFRDVSFRYSENHPYILSHVSFSVSKGEFLGIVGYSGAGKTTILRLLNLTYAPTSGEIFINGFHISCYPVRMLRRRIASVWQEGENLRFFDGCSIANNMALGNLWASNEEDINFALSSAEALSFVEKRSSGIYAPLRCHEYSGGELERLCIARAMMKRKTGVGVYVFDEATNALDMMTEEKIFNDLGLNRKSSTPRDATFVVVAHRLATLRDADHIVVLSDGRIVQSGSWEELSCSEPDSCFSRMLRSQQVPEFVS
ncbi:putative ABC transporter [Trypanosoma theileri]|uniref:Putative ABC transporter n=1 Tax=Trypanosoma theileri TaxID=67003 RepID=A0A1X0NRF7_9TRYP|nr:putative ABC transporter [Trypanosoma theileri]ORC87295.1 putative ABC transporter [Trypanosoma theileri]